MKRHPRVHHPRGSLLIETIVWLSIMAAISILTTEMMVSGMRLEKQCFARDTLIVHVDSAIDRLRRDAWQAAAIQIADHQVKLVNPDGTVLWRMESDHTLTRMNPADSLPKQSWKEMPDFSFTVTGPLLTVKVQSRTDVSESQSITLPSQRMLAGGVP
jgi:hypothetical protein